MKRMQPQTKKKSRVLVLFITALLILAVSQPVYAQAASTQTQQQEYDELLQESGVLQFWDALPDDTADALEQAGISPDGTKSRTAVDSVFSYLSQLLYRHWGQPVKAFALLLALLLLCAVLQVLLEADSTILMLGGAAAACGMVIGPLVALLQESAAAVKACGTFLSAAVPVYAGILVAGGYTTGAGSYSALLLFAGNAVTFVAQVLLLPMLGIFLAFSMLSSLQEGGIKPAKSIYSAAKWVLIFTVTVFTSVMGLQSVISAAADNTLRKASKLIISGVVPVVGSLIGDAAGTVQSSVQLIKSGAGAFGLLAMLFLFLPVLVQALLWNLLFTLLSACAALFDCTRLCEFFTACKTAVSLLLAVLISCGVIALVCAGLVLSFQ